MKIIDVLYDEKGRPAHVRLRRWFLFVPYARWYFAGTMLSDKPPWWHDELTGMMLDSGLCNTLNERLGLVTKRLERLALLAKREEEAGQVSGVDEEAARLSIVK